MKRNAISIITTLVLLLATLAFAWSLEGYYQVIDLFAIALIIVSSIYLGVALSSNNWKREVSVSGMLILVAAFGVWWNPWLLVVSLVSHGFWDLAYGTAGAPDRYAPRCVIYDWSAGVYVGTYLLTVSV